MEEGGAEVGGFRVPHVGLETWNGGAGSGASVYWRRIGLGRHVGVRTRGTRKLNWENPYSPTDYAKPHSVSASGITQA